MNCRIWTALEEFAIQSSLRLLWNCTEQLGKNSWQKLLIVWIAMTAGKCHCLLIATSRVAKNLRQKMATILILIDGGISFSLAFTIQLYLR